MIAPATFATIGAVIAERFPLFPAALLLAPLALSIACDSSARSASPDVVAPLGESRNYETCASTSDCVDSLRCIDRMCQVEKRSRLGDFHAASGRRLLGLGDPELAARSFNQAVTNYEKESLEPPMDLLCEQGGALAQAREDTQLAEAAARILHKCILGVPASSHLARRAMGDLALLTEVGLESDLLARGETADLYITGTAQQPNLDSLQLTVTGDDKNKKRSYASLITALQTPAIKTAFAGCWQTYWKASKNEQLNVTLPFSYRFILDEDDESRDRAVLKVEPHSAPTASALAAAAQCVESAALPVALEAAKGMRDDTRWKSDVRIRIGN